MGDIYANITHYCGLNIKLQLYGTASTARGNDMDYLIGTDDLTVHEIDE